MAIKKRSIIIISFIAIFVFAMGLFVGCSEKTTISSSGDGQVVESVNDEGDKTYTAVADQWNEFKGWYSGDTLYSSDDEIIIKDSTPKNLKAIFATSGEIFIDRFLNGYYNKIKNLEENNYFNFNNKFKLNYNSSSKNEIYYLEMTGSLAVKGEENLFKITIKNEKSEEKLSFFIKNNSENTKLYLKSGAKEFVYDLPAEFNQISLMKKETLQGLSGNNYTSLKKILGFDNSLKVVESVKNEKNIAKISLSADKFLEFVKNIILPNLTSQDVWLKEVIETFTKKYQGISRSLPKMTFNISLQYQGEGIDETLKEIEGSFDLKQDYKLELEQTVVLEKSSTVFKLLDFNHSFSENQTLLEDEEGFNQINVLNLSLGGKVDFAVENAAMLDYEILDTYNISLNSDVNLFALSDALNDEKIDWEKIDWENFGYLNLRVSLIEKGTQTQLSKHNGVTDYINILIDSDKFGANMLVYGGLYNPKMNLISENYILNNTFYLPKIMSTYKDSLNNAIGKEQDESASLEGIINAFKGVISFIVNSEGKQNLNEVIYKFLEGLMGEDEIIRNSFSLESTENGDKVLVKLESIKDVITKNMTNFSSWLGYSNFNSNLFGSSATHLSFSFDRLTYGEVNQETKDEDLKIYNEKHSTLLTLAAGQAIAGIDDYDFSSSADYKAYLSSLEGKNRTIKGRFSDGSESATFTDYKSSNQSITLTIWKIEVVEEIEGKAKLMIYFTYTQGTFAQTLFNKNIPYGIIACEKVIKL